MQVQVNWVKLVQLQVPLWMRRKRVVVFLLVCISGVRSLYATFLAYRKAALYNLRITGQTIYLEKALNDRFDFVDRLIYIETLEDASQFYLYNKVEAAAPVYFYNRHNPAHSYLVGEYAVAAGRIWKALVASPSDVPSSSSAEWSDEGERLYLLNKAEGQNSFDFIVWVPAGLVFDQNEMEALIDLYKLAGKTYVILTY